MDSSKHNTIELPASAPRRAVVPMQTLNVLPTQNLRKKAVKRDTRFPLLVYGVLILAVLMGGYVLFTGPLSTFTHAVVPLSVSEVNTTIYAYPLKIKADGRTQSKIDLFVANSDSLPVPNKIVVASSTIGTLSPTNALTNNMGHASYILTMEEPGIATIQFTVDSVLLGKQITVQGE